MKVVLAYSGGLDTSIILRWLQETYNAEVITFTADLGQGEEVEPARAKALEMGVPAENIHIEDVREEFVRDFGVNVVGGCCGTTVEHLRQLVERVRGLTPRPRVLVHLFERGCSVVSHPTRQHAIGRCEQFRHGVAMIFVPRCYFAHMPRLRAQPTA